ncbi:regulatory protein RecX [Ferrimonas balearica]|uniref:regulatory protein RecX n=1 Tax=Ferrimonas balearica TaxID=44012 RepID=UPI001C997406|nr:regulatory protein RecX [Ferrimonas balearica]MBY5921469.1 recombination regulator RecX [Ferrimonas balearica]MBY5995846.1 recombination regulator RecX [Ferrimonas balearica]
MAKEPQDRDPVAAAVGLLSRRDHSREELKRKLRSRGFVVSDIDKAIERVDEWGYLNDARFAEGFVRYRSGRGLGPIRLANELRERGVSSDLIRQTFAEAEQDWFALCLEVCERKFGNPVPTDFKARAKVQRYLAYRGFDMEQIRYALESLRG